MNILKISSQLLLAGIAAVTLTACSSGPSAGDMKQAFVNAQAPRSVLLPLLKTGSAYGTPTDMSATEIMNVMNVERSGCAEASGQPGFVCDFRLKASIDGQQREGDWVRYRFFDANGWQIAPVR